VSFQETIALLDWETFYISKRTGPLG